MSFGDDVHEKPVFTPDTPRERILHALDEIGEDEVHVLALVADRILAGYRDHGEIRPAADLSSCEQEALEQIADGLVAVAAALNRKSAIRSRYV